MEYKRKRLITILGVAAFLGFCSLVVIGQKSISLTGAGMMLLGLAGIVVCLWVYNITHR